MNTKFFQLAQNDWIKGLIVAVLTALIATLQQAISTHGIDVSQFDWGFIGNTIWVAVVAYLTKNLGTNEKGKFVNVVDTNPK